MSKPVKTNEVLKKNKSIINGIIKGLADKMDLNKAIKGVMNNDSTLPMRKGNRS